MQGLNIVVTVPKKPLKWYLRREGSNGTVIILLLLSNVTHRGFDGTMRKEFSMMSFQYSDNQERKLKTLNCTVAETVNAIVFQRTAW